MSFDAESGLHLVPADPHVHQRRRLLGELALGEVEEEFDAFATELARQDGVPCAMVNLFGGGVQNFVGMHVPAAMESVVGRTMPMEYGYCPEFVTRRKPLVLHDVGVSPRFEGNPVVYLLGLRSYAGAPLIHDGIVLGTVCTVGLTARPLDSAPVTHALITKHRDALMQRIWQRVPRPRRKFL